MKRALVLIGVAALLATLAWADTTQVLARFFGGIYVGPRSAAVSTNNITRVISSAATYYDPANLVDGGCTDTAVALTGARVGDPCFVGVGAVLGVTDVSLMQQDIHGQYSCWVGVDGGGFLRRCQTVAQGAYNPDGGTFYLRVISSQ